MSCLKKLSRIRSEETALVKRHHIRLQLLYGKIRKATHQCRLQVFVLDIFTIKIVHCALVDDVDQMELCYLIDIYRKKVIVFDSFGCC